MRENMYERAPYLKANAKIQGYINFWFRLGMITMIGGAALALILILGFKSPWGLLTFPVGFLFAELVCRRRWKNGFTHSYHMISTISRINIAKLWAGHEDVLK